jgi:hypothetical protein
MALDSVVKRLMMTAINYSIGEARKRAKLGGLIELRRSLQVRSSEDFRAGMICGEAFARSAVMIRMYMGRESTKEESDALVQLLMDRTNDIKDSLFKGD